MAAGTSTTDTGPEFASSRFYLLNRISSLLLPSSTVSFNYLLLPEKSIFSMEIILQSQSGVLLRYPNVQFLKNPINEEKKYIYHSFLGRHTAALH